jgi:hypothetical protein
MPTKANEKADEKARWEEIRQQVYDIYIVQNTTLEELMCKMKKKGYKYTYAPGPQLR